MNSNASATPFATDAAERQRDFAADVRAGLTSQPRVLPLDAPFGRIDANVQSGLGWWPGGFVAEVPVTPVFFFAHQEEWYEIAARSLGICPQ